MGRPAAKIIGDQLRAAREARHLTVAQAAKLLHVKRQTLYNYENGKWLPKMRVLIAAAAALNWPFEVSGCRLVPDEVKHRPPAAPLPVQTAFPFTRARSVKPRTVRIRQRDGELEITTVVRIGT